MTVALAVALWLTSAVILTALWWAERREQRRPHRGHFHEVFPSTSAPSLPREALPPIPPALLATPPNQEEEQ